MLLNTALCFLLYFSKELFLIAFTKLGYSLVGYLELIFVLPTVTLSATSSISNILSFMY